MSDGHDYGSIDDALLLSKTKSPDELDAMAAAHYRRDRWRRIVMYFGVIFVVLQLLLPESLKREILPSPRAWYSVVLFSIAGIGFAFALLGMVESKRTKIVKLALHLQRQNAMAPTDSSEKT